jgi:transcriptional regulator with XRE-family HTH domain
MTTHAELGERLRDLRTEKGMSQADLAQAMAEYWIRWDRTIVTRIEAGERKLHATELFALSKALDTPVDRFNPQESVEGRIARLERRVADIARIRQNLEYEAQGITDHINRLRTSHE